MKGEISLKNIIGKGLLNKIQNSYLEYLESSAAIYEVNGDYASALFSSRWCDFLNQASRKLAGDISEGEAMKSGKWICHEDRWATSLKSIKDKEPCEIECSGGIKIFAAPIIADGMVIGSNNAGVSNPPTDKKKINEIAEKYKVDPEELLKVAKDYHPRPEYVFNAAKNHISSAAYTIADIFLRKQAEQALNESEKRYRSLLEDVVDSSAVGIFILDSAFKVVWVNRALERYFGLRRDEIIGKDKRQLIRKGIKDIFENAELFSRRVIATYDDNTYIENFECHVLPGDKRKERWLRHWSQPIQAGIYAGGRIEHYTDITERKKIDAALKKTLHALGKRVKELDCLFGLSKLVEKPDISLEGIFQGLANLIPPTWQYPAITCAKIIFGNKEFKTDNFKSTRWKQSSDIMVKGKKTGSVEVCYLEERPEIDEGPFLKEERNLISAIAERLGKMIESRKAEEAIRKANEEWERTFNALPDLIALMDDQYRIIQINKAMADKLGIAQQKAKGLKCYENIHGTKEPPPFCPHSQTLADGNIHTAEIHEDRLGGDFLVTTSPVHDIKGMPISCVHVARNITERKKREEELKKAAVYIDAMGDALIVLNTQRKVIRLNKAALTLLGYSQKEVPELTFGKIFSEKDHKRHYAEMNAGVKTGKVRSFETMILTKDGKEIPVLFSVTTLKDSRGDPIGFVGVCKDITERKRSQAILEISLHALVERVKELDCLFGLSKLVEEPDISLEGIFQGLANLIPPGWQYPAITCAKIIFENKEFKTDNFKSTRWKQSSDIMVKGEITGSVEVCYLEERPEIDEGPFLKEERNLISAIAERLGSIIERKKAEKTLEEQKIALEKKNIALKEILYQLEIEKKHINDNMLANIDKLLLPGLRKLRSRGTDIASKYIDVLQNNLENLASSFGRKLSEESVCLTPRGIEICNMIKSGLDSKEIAELLHIDKRSVDGHRLNIRKKFGLDKRKINLTSFLRNL